MAAYHFEIKEVCLNAGEEIAGSSCATSYKNRLFIGSACDDKFLVCVQK